MLIMSVPPASTSLTLADVVALQAVQARPAVSVLMTTRPRDVMDGADAATLLHLVDRAETRLKIESAADADRVVGQLRSLAERAAVSTTRRSVALYASAHMSAWFVLPVGVRDRVVVDPTFATRDLVRSMHRTPLHALLVLTTEQARLFQGAGDALVPVARHRFPMHAHAFPSADAFRRAVDSALSAHLRSRPSPVVIAGVARTVADFRHTSTATTRWAGTIPGSHMERPLDELAELARPVLERYLRSRELQALQALANTPRRRTASGLDAAWLAARSERPAMLVVEEDMSQHARLSEDGDELLPADDPEEPGVLDDVVDELIETVLRRGGWVALTASGALTEHGGVALTIRDR